MNDSGRNLYISSADGARITFSMEPIVDRRTRSVFAYELLYRGPRQRSFKDIDAQLMAHLAVAHPELPTLFINVCNDTMTGACDEALLQAARHCDIVIELSEQAMDAPALEKISSRVNALAAQGVRFALDDFGAGHDGCARLFAMKSVSLIKIDGSLLEFAAGQPSAARMLRNFCSMWRSAGIRTIAECIEDTGRLGLADYLDVDMIQGYLVNRSECREIASSCDLGRFHAS